MAIGNIAVKEKFLPLLNSHSKSLIVRLDQIEILIQILRIGTVLE